VAVDPEIAKSVEAMSASTKSASTRSTRTASAKTRIWSVVPAAGIGSRMGLETPKQYAKLNDKTIIEHTLSRLFKHPLIEGVVVAISQQDSWWQTLSLSFDKPLFVVEGGKERFHSVLNGLIKLEGQISPDDWVLVHDAARPCVRLSDIDNLIGQLIDHPVGGILACAVCDTMKRSNNNNDIIETVERTNLWHALTPQMFRLGILKSALLNVLESGESVTDEACAVEFNNLVPQLVAGCRDNIKVTHYEDLSLAEYYLKKQAEGI